MKLHRFSASTLALLAAWFVLSVLSACRQTPTSPSGDNHDTCCNGSLILNVHDSATGAHLLRGTYILSGNNIRDTAQVGTNGTVVFSHLCPGTYEVVGMADGYNRHVEHYMLGCNDEQHHDFNLSPASTTDCCGGALILNVHDSATGHAMTSGTYVLSGNGTTQTVHLNDHGQAIFTHLCPGNYEVVGEADGYNRHVEHYTLGCNDEQHHDFNLSPVSTNDCCHGIITLILRDSATGTALSGGTVTLWQNNHNLGSRTVTADGVSWDGLCQGSGYSFSYSGNDHYAAKEWSIEALGCNEHRTTDRNIAAIHTTTNCDNASMTVTVVDSAHHDTHLAGVTVTIRVDGSSTIVAQGTTDSNGQFTANHLLGHTTYIVTFSKDGYNEKHFAWQFTDCRDYTETFGLSAK